MINLDVKERRRKNHWLVQKYFSFFLSFFCCCCHRQGGTTNKQTNTHTMCRTSQIIDWNGLGTIVVKNKWICKMLNIWRNIYSRNEGSGYVIKNHVWKQKLDRWFNLTENINVLFLLWWHCSKLSMICHKATCCVNWCNIYHCFTNHNY